MRLLKKFDPNAVVDPDTCTGGFDCEASVASFVAVGSNNNVLEQGQTYTITVEWVDCDGNRAVGAVIPMTADGVAVGFDSSSGTTNTYTYTVPVTGLQDDYAIEFQWGLPGNAEDLCSLDLQVSGSDTALEFPPLKSGALPTDPNMNEPPPAQGATGTQGIFDITRVSFNHQYATRSVWNINETALFDGEKVYSATAPYAQIGADSPFNSEAVWSYVDPDIVCGIHNATQQFGLWDYTTGNQTFTQVGNIGATYSSITIGEFEGSKPANDSHIVLVGTVIATGVREMFTLDLNTGAVIGSRPLSSPGNFDNVKIAKDSSYAIEMQGGQGIVRWNLDMTSPFVITTESKFHAATCTDVNGDACIAVFEQSAGVTTIDVYRISDGALFRYDLPAPSMDNGHISANNINRPGYVYISAAVPGVPNIALRLTNSESNMVTTTTEGRPVYDQSVQYECWGYPKQELSGDLATYLESARISPSPSGRMVFFGSGWYDTIEEDGFFLKVA